MRKFDNATERLLPALQPRSRDFAAKYHEFIRKKKYVTQSMGVWGRVLLSSWEFLVGVCRPVLQTLTLFQTKKSHFSHPFSDLGFRQKLR